MNRKIEEKNKALVLKAFDTLFNKRDYVAAEKYWSPRYIQHSAHVAPGREGLFNLIKSLPPTLEYEPGAIVAEGDHVIVLAVHRTRYSRTEKAFDLGSLRPRAWCNFTTRWKSLTHGS
jgi:predicted SnoaL-like aldol condensation-catalyzing enzyme